MPETKVRSGQLGTTLSSKTIDNTNTINTDLTKLAIAGGTNGQVLSTNGSSVLSFITAGGGVSDGDKGDITVSASGATWTVDNDAISYAKIQNVSAASKLLGRGSAAGSGDTQEITLGSGLTMSATTLSVSDGDKGDITVSASGATWTVDNLAITGAKIANTTITATQIANTTITATQIANTTITATQIANDAVTYAKIQNVSAASKLLGRGSAAGSGDTEEITLGSGLTMSGTTLSASGGGTSQSALKDSNQIFSTVNGVFSYDSVLNLTVATGGRYTINIYVAFECDSAGSIVLGLGPQSVISYARASGVTTAGYDLVADANIGTLPITTSTFTKISGAGYFSDGNVIKLGVYKVGGGQVATKGISYIEIVRRGN